MRGDPAEVIREQIGDHLHHIRRGTNASEGGLFRQRVNKLRMRIEGSLAQSIESKRVAAGSGLGVTTFHRQFKQITGLSPIQFQKQLRLLEARRRLIYSGHSVAEAAYEVGYESATQFNREYSRYFGAPPAQDASRLRQMEEKRQAV